MIKFYMRSIQDLIFLIRTIQDLKYYLPNIHSNSTMEFNNQIAYSFHLEVIIFL